MAEIDDCESEFTLPMKKCRKPRASAKQQAASGAPATKQSVTKASVIKAASPIIGRKRTYKKAANQNLQKIASESFGVPPSIVSKASAIEDQMRLPESALNIDDENGINLLNLTG